MQAETIHTLAQSVLDKFTSGERKSDDTGRQIRCLPHEGQPGYEEWAQELCHAAHTDPDGSSMLPDDWRYEMIEDALQCIAQADDEDGAEEAADTHEAPVYNAERSRWLASHLYRASYVDEAEEEYGGEKGRSTWDRLALGYVYEFRIVFRAVLDALREELERREEAAEVDA